MCQPSLMYYFSVEPHVIFASVGKDCYIGIGFLSAFMNSVSIHFLPNFKGKCILYP